MVLPSGFLAVMVMLWVVPAVCVAEPVITNRCEVDALIIPDVEDPKYVLLVCAAADPVPPQSPPVWVEPPN